MGIFGGKAKLASLEFVGKLVPFRIFQESSELRTAAIEEGELRKDVNEIKKDVLKRDLQKFIKDEKDGVVHAENAFGALMSLIGNCTYDLHTIKMGMKEFHQQDDDIEKHGASREKVDPIKGDVEKALARMNKKLNSIGSALIVLSQE